MESLGEAAPGGAVSRSDEGLDAGSHDADGIEAGENHDAGENQLRYQSKTVDTVEKGEPGRNVNKAAKDSG